MPTERKIYISIANVIAALSVVYLHNNNFWSYRPGLGWVSANIIESVFYFAVPIFFMISGVTLIDYEKRYDIKQYFKKRFEKTVIPFVVWSLVAVLVKIIIEGKNSIDFAPIPFISSLLNCSYMSIYWFFPSIFSIYLCIPVIAAIPETRRKKIFGYMIVCSFILDAVIPFLNLITKSAFPYNSTITFILTKNSFVFVLIGYYIDRYPIKLKNRILIYIIGLAGLLTHLIGTQMLSQEAGKVVTTFKGYTALTSLCYSTALFVLFRYFPFDKLPKFVIKIITFFNAQTLGIYVSHYLILRLFGFYFPSVNRGSFVFRVFGSLVLFAVSGCFIKLLQKIPFLRKCVP